ncbi:MAG: fumarylacetoacetate hydrolase family protein [Frankia sp.]|nr:fumarylacetoacetate hydrolase family protein [Frankia sp.]
MRIAKFRHQGVVQAGVVTVDAATVDGATAPRGTVQPVRQTLAALVHGEAPEPVGAALDLTEVELLAPLTADCRGLLCVGINYLEHQQESAEVFEANVPEHPIVFFKTPSAVADPDADLVLDDAVSERFDWEVELGVVIGRGGRNIPADEAGAHIFGYTVVNDVTARDVQHRHKQWHLGKNVDAATPVGPWVVTADELGFPPVVDVALTVNGVEKQRANTKQMIFGIAELIAVMSRYVALRPGDVLATGTPSGVGFTRQPPEFLRAGDLVIASIDGVGALRTRVRSAAAATA